jgi:hypothetical protein
MRDVRVQMAFGEESVSVRHLWCWGTLLSGRLIRLMRFNVWVNHGSTLEDRTTFTEDARGAKAAADAGSSCGGILLLEGATVVQREDRTAGVGGGGVEAAANKEYWEWRWSNRGT